MGLTSGAASHFSFRSTFGQVLNKADAPMEGLSE
jgi:hypothetical protein